MDWREHMNESKATPAKFDPATTTGPDPSLLTYYIIVSLLTVFLWPIFLPVLYCKYRTLRYKFDDEGVSMAYGLLFRREIYLTYRRIQDIHVTRGIVQRKLGLANVAVQTASGSGGAEMTIEGIRHPEALRDYLYSRMRGASSEDDDAGAASEAASNPTQDETLQLLSEIHSELKQLRERLAEMKP
jgi:putative membrane protein